MKRIIFALALLLVISACGDESGAKKTAEGYMDAVKMGNDFDQMEALEGFIDVFDYEYLHTISVNEVEDTLSISYERWKDHESEQFASFIDYKDYYKELFNGYEVIKDDNEELILWDGEEINKIFTLLYNVEIANEAGEKLFKKAEITVEEGSYWDGDNIQDGWIITDVYLR